MVSAKKTDMPQLFLKGSFWSAWHSSSDRRMLSKSMKLILGSLISLKNCYFFNVKEDKVIIIRNSEPFNSFYDGFSAQGGVSRLSARLPFHVGHHLCSAYLGIPPSHQSLTFDQDTDVQSFEIIFSLPNRQACRKQKKLGLI